MRIGLAIGILFCLGCSPVSVSRIGPPVDPRSADCEIEVLEEGTLPTRPHRDVGMVSLENCQDFRVNPCKKWLVEAACSLGGHFAYRTEDQNLRDGRPDMYAGPITYRVVVGAYIADLVPDADKDPVLNSQQSDCDENVASIPDEPAPQRCTE